MTRPARDGRSRRAGFTLVEALAAFVILAVALGVVQQGLVSAVAGVVEAEEILAAERVARSLLASPDLPLDLARPRIVGRLNGRGYTLSVEALPFQPARTTPGGASGATWLPVRVRLAVDVRRGRTLDIESVRLVRQQAL